MKNLAKLNGAKALSKKEQKSINGGHNCRNNCAKGCRCIDGRCIGPLITCESA